MYLKPSPSFRLTSVDLLNYEKIKVALFDMGGVLVEIHPERVFHHWATATGLPQEHFSTRWHVESNMELYETGRISFAAYIEFLESHFQVRMSENDWKMGWNALVGDCFEEVFNQVRLLAKLMRVYCFTNSNPEHESVWAIEHRVELSVFTEIFNSSTIGCRKPDARAFDHVLDLMSVDPGQCFFIDDLSPNVEAARRSGMQAFHTDGPLTTKNAIASLINGVKNM